MELGVVKTLNPMQVSNHFYQSGRYVTVNLKAQSFTLKPQQTKTSCLCVGPCSWCWLQKAAHLCGRGSHAALTHRPATSSFWQ